MTDTLAWPRAHRLGSLACAGCDARPGPQRRLYSGSLADACDRCIGFLASRRERWRMHPGAGPLSPSDPWPDRCRFCLTRSGAAGYLLLRVTPICDACLDAAALALKLPGSTSLVTGTAR